MDLLFDVNVRGYIVGATNVLFKQKRQLMDVLVEVGKIDDAILLSIYNDFQAKFHLPIFL